MSARVVVTVSDLRAFVSYYQEIRQMQVAYAMTRELDDRQATARIGALLDTVAWRMVKLIEEVEPRALVGS